MAEYRLDPDDYLLENANHWRQLERHEEQLDLAVRHAPVPRRESDPEAMLAIDERGSG